MIQYGMLIADLIFDFVAYWGERTDSKFITFCQKYEPQWLCYLYLTNGRL